MNKKEIRNDQVNGLKTKVIVEKDGGKKTILRFAGKYGQGYDGCGTHTHQ